MASEKPSPFLVDAVKASASRFKETKNALEARQKELDARQGELESLRVDLDRQAERLRAEREEFQKEKEQVNAGRTSIDHDLASVRMDRERVGGEEKRVQDWARTLNEREKAIKENEDRVKRLDLELSSHLKDSEGKIQSLMEREMLKISEEMYARQKESAAQHESFVELQETFRQELLRLASERERLAGKEKSLVEAEKYLAAALEASGMEVDSPPEIEVKAPPPPPTIEPRAPKPPIATPTPSSRAAESFRDEIFEEEHNESRPKVSRADALERMTRALETAKKARDLGRNVSEIRKVLKQARAAFRSERVPPEGVPSGCPGADDPRPRDREEGPRPGAERERDPEGAEAGARRLRERRLRHGFEARRGDPQGARGDSPDSLDPSGDPPFAIAWIGIAYTGTPGTRGSCI